MSEYSPEQKELLEEARTKITDAIDQDGSYTHNVISIVLRGIAHQISYEAADELVDEFNLEPMYSIPKSNKKGSAKSAWH